VFLRGKLIPIGTNVVKCTATGVSGLGAQCSFTVTVLGPNGTLVQLQTEMAALLNELTNAPALSGVQGIAPAVAGPQDCEHLERALAHLDQALSSAWWWMRHIWFQGGHLVFEAVKGTIQELLAMLKDNASQVEDMVVQDWVDRLVKVARLLAGD